MQAEATTIKGVVRAVDGQQAVVEIEHGGCGRCHEKGGCGGQQLTQMFCSGPKTYHVANTCAAAIGDHVTVAISAGTVTRTANLAYGVPLLAAIAGAVAGTALYGDLGAIAGAGIGLLTAFAYIRQRSRQPSGNPLDQPHIVSRL